MSSAESPSVIRCCVPLCSIHPRCGGAESADQSLPRPHTLASNLVRWVEARAKLDALYAVFSRAGTCLSCSSADVPSILNTDIVGKPAANHY